MAKPIAEVREEGEGKPATKCDTGRGGARRHHGGLIITSARQSQAPSRPFPAPPALSGGCRAHETKAQKLGCASDSLRFLTLHGPGIFIPGHRKSCAGNKRDSAPNTWADDRSYDQARYERRKAKGPVGCCCPPSPKLIPTGRQPECNLSLQKRC